MTRTVYSGPCNTYLVLDDSKIIPDNPGDDTPALVYYRDCTATFSCALGEGEVESGGKVIQLPKSVMDWLDEAQEIVDKFYDDFYREYDKSEKKP